MKKNLTQTLVIVAIFSMLLSSCYLPASKTTAKVPQPGAGTAAVPSATSPIKDIISGTATAIARAASPTVVIVQPTSAGPTKTPAATQPVVARTPTSGGGSQPLPTSTPVSIQPAATATTFIPIPTLSRPSSYTLQKGEWPICIARRYDLNYASLLSLNGMTMDSKPGVGTVLKIPASGNWDSGARSLKSHPDRYTVSSGETVNSIACVYGDVSPEAILAANGLGSSGSVSAGQTIIIP